MPTFTRRGSLVLVLVAILFTAAPGVAVAGGPWLPTIAGTWYFSTGVGPGAALPGLVTFNADGTLLYSDAMMFGGVPVIPMKTGPFHGVWRMTGRHAFGGTSFGLLFDPASGSVIGIARARSSLRFDGSLSKVTGTMFFEMVMCSSPVTCPDPTDPTLLWMPVGDPANGFAVSLTRVTRVPAGPLQ